MTTIGVLYGMEESFPPALVDSINAMGVNHVCAEHLKTGGVQMAARTRYGLIIDRISHDIPFYRSYLKIAVLTGSRVINNPFWWSADDKFFNYSLAAKLGVAVPRTVLLPHKKHPEGTTDRSMRNLEYPLDWDRIFNYVGFPAFLKPHDGGGWKSVYKVKTPEELFAAYDDSGDLCMTLQAAVNFTDYFRCFVVNQEKVHVMRYNPAQPHHLRYVPGNPPPERALSERMERDALVLCRALGYDLNTVEFAVQDGIPYAIDFMNPAPDAGLESVGAENFRWIVDAVAEMAVARALEPTEPPVYRWSTFLEGRAAAGPAGHFSQPGGAR
jgi:glutathione synthase/RimK-type ligase-like ATP-grasp enzyme